MKPHQRHSLSLPVGGVLCGAVFAAISVQHAFAAPAVIPAPIDREIIVTPLSGTALRIEYHPVSVKLDTVVIGGKEFFRVDCAEGSRLSPVDNAGLPDIPWRSIPVAFPSRDGSSVRVIAADYEDIHGLAVLPVPTLEIREGYLEIAGYAASKETPRGFAPDTIARLVTPHGVRSALIGGIKVWPAQYDAASHTLRKYSRIVLEVSFGNGPRRPVTAGDAALLANAVVNRDMLSGLQTAATPVRKTAATSSVLASGDWYRLTVSEEGIYKIDAAYLAAAGINTSAIDPRTIKIYGNGGQEIPEDVSVARPSDLVENAIYVEGEADGQLAASDYVLFFGRGTRGITYDPLARTLRHHIHHYSDVNYYWLTFGGARGKRMASQPSLTASPDVVVEKFADEMFNEDEKVNLLGSGKDWYGQSLTGPSASFTYVNVLPGLVANDIVTYRYTLVAQDASSPQFTVREGGTILGTYLLGPASVYQVATAGTWTATGTSSLANNSSQLTMAFSSPSSASEAWIDWFEIQYPRMLWGVNNALRFRSPDASGIGEFRLQQFSAMPTVLNVSDPANVRLLSGVSGSYMFRDSLHSGSVTEYCAAGSASWKTPAAIQKMANQDLHGYAAGADYIIITSQEFRQAADRLKTFREQPANGGLKTVVVDVNQIYNEFGGGLPDITAIRDFLSFASQNWAPQPAYVLLFGGASYDYKGILGSKSSYVPTWQTLESRDDIGSYATDDFFTSFENGMVPSMVGGRISSRTLAEANVVVDKIIRYETQSARDSWKTRVLFVADDAWTSDGGYSDGTIHSDDAEALSNPSLTPDEFEKQKIYIADYPTVFNAQGRRKPGAAADIITDINQGVLILNYSGHGNPKVWAHEWIFEVTTSIPQLVNSDRLALFFLATCNFSQFDDPKNYTGSELLMNKPDGGSVAVISASRKVYQGGNAALNQGTYRQLFLRDANGRVVVERPAKALFLYKSGGLNLDNDQKFFFMGDPTTRLAYPTGYASIDSINGFPVDSAGGIQRISAITLKALSRVSVVGTVRDASNMRDSTFTGTLSLRVNDVSRLRTIVDFYPGYNWQYVAAGGTVFRGENSIVAGKFRSTFVVPKDISYADTTGNGRLMAYFTRPEGDGAGFTNVIRISGTDSAAVVDHEGPGIHISLDSRSFRPGDVVSEHPMLIVDLNDSSGINTSTSGIGHRIEAWLNNSSQSRDLTSFYTSKRDDYREGAVQMPLTGLPNGKNTIRVRAWDSYNNSATADTYFDVATSDQLSIVDLFNYPNPFADETLFTFRQNQQNALDVEIKVYTIAGRLIQDLRTTSMGDMMVRVPWDGRDRDGDRVANGVYLYKVLVRTVDGRFSSEALGKLAVTR